MDFRHKSPEVKAAKERLRGLSHGEQVEGCAAEATPGRTVWRPLWVALVAGVLVGASERCLASMRGCRTQRR